MAATLTTPARMMLTDEQRDLIRRTICPDATDDELALFFIQCERTGLDAFSKQIYAIRRWNAKLQRDVVGIQVSIDGLRLIAERTGRYAGQLGPLWCGPDGVWKEVWLGDGPPAAAKVGVLRTDFREPLWAVARWGAYVQTDRQGNPTPFWRRMPDLMIGKAAESLALRKAFPQELSGLYTSEELREEGLGIGAARPQKAIPSRRPTELTSPIARPGEARAALAEVVASVQPDPPTPLPGGEEDETSATVGGADVALLRRTHDRLIALGKLWGAAFQYLQIEVPDQWQEPANREEAAGMAAWLSQADAERVAAALAPKGKPAPAPV